MRKEILKGMKVLDFTRLLPGPFGTQILADFGAEIVKVEDVQNGDYARMFPPLYQNFGAFFAALNRDKKSIGVDLKTPEGLKVIQDLVVKGGFDIVIEGFRPGVAQKLGIDYESLRAFSPNLIYASLPGFGDGSPKRDSACHDMNALALSGILSITGSNEKGPTLPGIQVDDLASGLYLISGLLAAVVHRLQTGKGQQLEVAMADVAFALNQTNIACDNLLGSPHGFGDNMLNGQYIFYNIYKTKDDRYMSVGAVEMKFWINVCHAIGLPELIEEQFASATAGNPHYEKIKARFAEKTFAQWREIFSDVDACVEPVLNNMEALEHPHYQGRNMVRKMTQGDEGEISMVDCPVKFQGSKEDAIGPIPYKGEHTDKILKKAGYSDEEITALKESGAIL